MSIITATAVVLKQSYLSELPSFASFTMWRQNLSSSDSEAVTLNHVSVLTFACPVLRFKPVYITSN